MKGQGFPLTKKRYDATFKKEAIRLAETSGKKDREVEQDFGLLCSEFVCNKKGGWFKCGGLWVAGLGAPQGLFNVSGGIYPLAMVEAICDPLLNHAQKGNNS